ncbi:YqiA/YcfP family alpha/beta fold hydrolase [Paraburkholderia sp. SOS3]|uniref:YqiA/YcfP family alpha/beta fold hydrolase n=1 Tax=Paraburkholderia sp. SOS3 TaxID=1926494 RepID=UPI0009474BCE|nr:YqiA/YcfP family alpha/beta fold hydrolase [Paraburkholderia sp. SOS3]APR36986.1 esterase [Paraburkholderia sp. SOS3]
MILYLHGFRSSPQSFKARVLAERLAALGRGDEWCCPQLPVSPLETIELAESLVKARLGSGAASNAAAAQSAPREHIVVIGSSLGGFFATHLAEKHGWPAVLLNPAVVPQRDLSAYLGEQPRVHGGGSIVVEAHHLDEMRALAVTSITRPERYYLFAATGDEVLDYREMLAHYPAARTKLIEGSDHSISEFADYVDDVIAFCDSAAAVPLATKPNAEPREGAATR